MIIPEPMHNVQNLIDAHHEKIADLPRPHMGASTLGHPCDRWLWLSFRWAVLPQFPGRVLRLFRRGQMEETTIVRDLRDIGVDIRNTNENQARVNFGAHVSGSIDGVIEGGLPEAPNKRHVAEFKTHSKKSFDDMVKNGVKKSKPMHWVQMQVYMQGTNIDRAFYLAVCKDDDRIYTERVHYKKEAADKAIARGKRLALEERLPPPISTDPSWYECKFCDAYQFCHKQEPTKESNCRTCANVTPLEDSTWRCERHDANEILVDFQRTGCGSHVIHPDLVPWKRKETDKEWQAIYIVNGKEIKNGEKAPDVFTSKEILSNVDACLNADNFVQTLRKDFDAEISG